MQIAKTIVTKMAETRTFGVRRAAKAASKAWSGIFMPEFVQILPYF